MDNEGKVVRLVAEPVVIATYREIAEHFGLTNPEKGRQKAKRAGWETEPQNHPADPVRVRVPQKAWEEAALSRERAARARARDAPLKGEEGEDPHPPSFQDEPPSLIGTLRGEAAALREALGREQVRADQAEARASQAEREREAARVEAAMATGEGRALRENLAHERGRAERAEAERDATRMELEGWTAGGPVARALRALLFRRGRP